MPSVLTTRHLKKGNIVGYTYVTKSKQTLHAICKKNRTSRRLLMTVRGYASSLA